MRDFLKGLELDKETIDSIMAEYGKNLQTLKEEKETLSETVETYKKEISKLEENSKNDADWKSKFEELQTSLQEQEAKRKAEEEDKILTNNIISIFGDKKFTSEYAKNGLMNDIKGALNNPENKGKGIQELFDEFTKDKEGIFENPNTILNDMEGMGDSEVNTTKNEVPMFW